MRVLGLDPGSRRTGWGIIERRGNHYTAVAFGQASVAASLPLPNRLHALAERIGTIMDEHRPQCVAVEEAFYHESVRSTLVLGHVRGALLVAAIARGFEVAEYSPRAIKLAVVGSGAAAKEQVAFMVRRLLGIQAKLSSDASDGLAVALCHLNRAGRVTPVTAAPRSAPGPIHALLARKVRG